MLEEGVFGTMDWRPSSNDPFGPILHYLSQDELGWSGGNRVCEQCWQSKALLFAFDRDPDFLDEGFLAAYEAFLSVSEDCVTGGSIRGGHVWRDLLAHTFVMIDAQEEASDPTLEPHRRRSEEANRVRCRRSFGDPALLCSLKAFLDAFRPQDRQLAVEAPDGGGAGHAGEPSVL